VLDDSTTPEQGDKVGPWLIETLREEFEDDACSAQVRMTHEDGSSATISTGGSSMRYLPLLELLARDRSTVAIGLPELVMLMRIAGFKIGIPCSERRGRIIAEAREQSRLDPYQLEELAASSERGHRE
jgi:hypothetical protein